MTADARKHLDAPYARRLWHALWIAMILVHLPALARGWVMLLSGDGELRLASFLALNLSAVLFVLKLRGVWWLRFSTDRRSLLSLTVAVALLHVNIGRDSAAFVAVREAPEAVASVCLLAGLRVVGDALRDLARPRRRPRACRAAAWRYAHNALRSQRPRWIGLDAPRPPPLH